MNFNFRILILLLSVIILQFMFPAIQANQTLPSAGIGVSGPYVLKAEKMASSGCLVGLSQSPEDVILGIVNFAIITTCSEDEVDSFATIYAYPPSGDERFRVFAQKEVDNPEFYFAELGFEEVGNWNIEAQLKVKEEMVVLNYSLEVDERARRSDLLSNIAFAIYIFLFFGLIWLIYYSAKRKKKKLNRKLK